MIGNSDEPTSKRNIPLRQYLFNPFRTVAGSKALFLGVAIILITAFLGCVSNTHFDGVLDVHTGQKAPAWLFFAENLIDWLCMVLFLSFSAFIVSRSQWRFIDVLGTQALSRWPTLLTALVMLPDANRRFGEYLMSRLSQGSASATISPIDGIIFFTAAIIALLMVIWMVALMYKGYAVSCNLRGAKAVVTFIVSLILAEALSKVLILALLSTALGANIEMGGVLGPSGQKAAVAGEFENDPQLIGAWESVDYVSDIEDFQAGTKRWKGQLFLKDVTFNENGRTSKSCIWTKDWILTADGETKAQYHIKSIDGDMYLFFPWLSGDVTVRGMKPKYYVLRKGAAVVSEFENDPQLIGSWRSVDFVRDINDFQAGTKRWKGQLFLKEVAFNENGRTSKACVWTKDWILTADGGTKAQYHIKSVDGDMYLFFPRLSGDVTIRGMKPKYYVLKKVSK